MESCGVREIVRIFSNLKTANIIRGMCIPRCIERLGALIPGINRMQPATMTSPDVYDYYDV